MKRKRVVLWKDGQALDVEIGSHYEAEYRRRGFAEKAPEKPAKKKAAKKKAAR